MENEALADLMYMPWPPTVNRMYITLRNGRRVSSKLHSDYKLEMTRYGSLVEQNSRERVQGAIAKKQKLMLLLKFNMPFTMLYTKKGETKRIDCSNRIKAVEDSLCKILDIDDRHFWLILAQKQLTQKGNAAHCDARILIYEG